MELMDNKPSSKSTGRRYTFLALIVSLLACIAFLVLGLLRGLNAAGLFELANPDDLNRWLLISIGLVVIGLAVYAILEPDRIGRFVTRRQTRYGSNLFVTVIAFLGILIFGNWIAYDNPVPVADLTADKENTLSPQVADAVKNLPDKIDAIAFFNAQSSRESAEKLLNNIKASSNGQFDYRFEDPDLNPLLARESGITGNGKILLTMGDRKEIASFASEEEILKAIIRLTNPNARAVYFLTGHGEATLDQGDTSLATAKQTLENKNYTVGTLNLLAEGKIPDDALAVIIAGPVKPLDANEVDKLKSYVDNGGSLVVMEDPYQFTDFGDAPDPLADYLAKDWGVTLDRDVILDTSSAMDLLYAVSAIPNSQHPITQEINSQNLVVIMPQARSLSLPEAPAEGVTLSALIQTTPPISNAAFSWGEMDYTASAEGTQVQYDEGVDKLGPLNMAVAGENSTTKGRVVVMGNSYFVRGQNFDQIGNGNFFINSIDWAAEQESLIQFTARSTTERTFVSPNNIGRLLIFLGSICILPGLILVAGIATWLARRRQG
jgi:ABC-type uncharacterized transport system involved in gliding motility auxiliary subunit